MSAHLCEHRRCICWAVPRFGMGDVLTGRVAVHPTAILWVKVTRCLDCGEQW